MKILENTIFPRTYPMLPWGYKNSGLSHSNYKRYTKTPILASANTIFYLENVSCIISRFRKITHPGQAQKLMATN